ncbi:MAG: Jag N-terminal domain-containing protein, partial [Butyrivibrio sp.]|nr:Jag N-terminal domain-containing protein [Butyrivibrio sp.]
MRNWIETTGKTVDEALLEASVALGTTAENIEYEVLDEGTSGFLGLNKKPAKIKAAVKATKLDRAVEFISDVLNVMGI